jgi:hypothetical protein
LGGNRIHREPRTGAVSAHLGRCGGGGGGCHSPPRPTVSGVSAPTASGLASDHGVPSARPPPPPGESMACPTQLPRPPGQPSGAL